MSKCFEVSNSANDSPVSASKGSVHAHNVDVSLLHQVGLINLITQTEDEYVSKALELASNIPLLSSLRMCLWERMLKYFEEV